MCIIELESPSLLAMCLKKIHGLDRPGIKILDASWVWTEPHSKRYIVLICVGDDTNHFLHRLKIAVDIEAGVLDEKLRVAQKHIVEFKISHKQCPDCIRENTDHTWGACVQIRQRVGHKMSFFHLESRLIKAGLHNSMIDVKVAKEGIDLFFKNKTAAQRVVAFINTIFPITTRTSKKLIGQDRKSNLHRNEFVISVEVVPLCRYDILVTPRESGRVPELVLVTQLSSNVHMINPRTLGKVEWSASKYFGKSNLKPLLTASAFVKFIVLNITPIARDSLSVYAFAEEFRVKDVGGILFSLNFLISSSHCAHRCSSRSRSSQGK